MKIRLALLLATSFLAVAPAARGSRIHDGVGFTPRFHGFDPDQVTFDTSADGTLWGGGAKYKARFTRSGAEYLPYLGSSAPRHFPVGFELSSARVGRVALEVEKGVPPVRTGRTIAYDRGGVLEQYVLDSGSMEQVFVFPDVPRSGELVVRIGVATELSPSATDDGLVFSTGLGSVRYGRAQAIDARGHRVDAPTTWEGDSIEIRVPQAFLADAVFPLTIDPVVSTFAPGASYAFTLLPDIAFDAANGVYMVSYENEIWGGDHDIYTELYDTSGTYVPGSFVAIDMTTDYWQVARCAENAESQQFYIAAVVGNHGDGSGYIAGRTRAANANTAGSIFVVDTGEPDIYLDVGGDPDPIRPGNFLVVWEAKTTATDHNIFARLVDASTGTPLGSNITIDNSAATLDEHPNVSKCDGRGPDTLQDWTIVWSRQVSATDHDIYGAQVHWDGTITNTTYAITFGASDDTYPQVSSPLDGSVSRPYMVAFQRDTGTGSHDIQGAVFDGPFFVAQANLSTLEGSAFSGQDQIHPSIDSDGSAFAVAYSEQVGSSTDDYDAYVSTFSLLGTTIQMAERHGQVKSSPYFEDFSQVCSTYSGNGGRFRFAIVLRTTSGTSTAEYCTGALYDADTFASFCFPGVDGVAACPCANPGLTGHGCDNSAGTGGAILTKTGTGSLSGDTVVFTTHGEKPTALSILLQGTSCSPAGVVYGQGVRCFAGTLKRLYSKSAVGGIITAPSGVEPAVSVRSAAKGDTISAGSTRYYLVFYRDPVVLGGCPATSTFNATQSGAICWRP